MYFSEFTASRRTFLGMAAGSLALVAGTGSTPVQAAKTRTSAKIVILGAGAGGMAIANRLVDRLEGAEITLVDGRQEHWYQPGFTLIAAGLKPASYSVSRNEQWLPRPVRYINEYAAELDPETQRVTTTGGTRLDYDYLIVATGLILDWDAIGGFSLDLVGQNGLGAVYAGPEYAAKTWRALDEFATRGGRAVFMRPTTEMKCAGAPLKYSFLTDDHLRRKGTRDASEVVYTTNSQALFGVPIVTEKLELIMRRQDINVVRHHVLKAIDAGARKATFDTPDGEVTLDYDFTNVVPPQRAPQVIRDSGLSWADRWTDQGWIEVEMDTLRHKRYPNVFGIGDINGVPKGKTAASVKWHLPVVEDHLVSELAGGEGTRTYNGYTSCPLITRVGRAMLIEFDYHDNLVPSFPGVVAPLEELWISWLMKEVALKATYNAMLRGRA